VRSSYHARRAVDAADSHLDDSRHAGPPQGWSSVPRSPTATRVPA
jgi:hypothetical protein